MGLLQDIFIAFLIGFLPVLVWLWFWLREDKLHPEPRKLLLLCFLFGMIAVPLVIPFQAFTYSHIANPIILYVVWAIIEEVFKFGAAYVSALRKVAFDEPIDALIYMITAALGFAALENTFFIMDSFTRYDMVAGILTSNMRFIGATLLHSLASATVGVFIAFAFYRPKLQRRMYTLFGIIAAVMLHTMFNLSIIYSKDKDTLIAFYSVWAGIVLLLLVFEKVKSIKQPMV